MSVFGDKGSSDRCFWRGSDFWAQGFNGTVFFGVGSTFWALKSDLQAAF
jgi:hypothetical protein